MLDFDEMRAAVERATDTGPLVDRFIRPLVGGHIACPDCGVLESVRYCYCKRPAFNRNGTCGRCRFWLRHQNGDHREVV